MTIAIRMFSVVIPIEHIHTSTVPGGFDGLLDRAGSNLGTYCWYDDHLYCDVSPNPSLVASQCAFWQSVGLKASECVGGELRWKDLCVIDHRRGLNIPCDWVCVDLATETAWHANHPRDDIVYGDGRALSNLATLPPPRLLETTRQGAVRRDGAA